MDVPNPLLAATELTLNILQIKPVRSLFQDYTLALYAFVVLLTLNA